MDKKRGPRLCVMGSGRGSNYVAISEAIVRGELDAEVVVVISDVEESGILKAARRFGHRAVFLHPGPKRTVLGEEEEARYVAAVKESGADLVVLAGFMRVLKKGFLDTFPRRVLNIHPSLLPRFRGLRAWEQALKAGVPETGCTVHVVTEGVDEGPMILQAAVPVRPDDSAESLHERIQREEHRIYPQAIGLYWEKLVQDGQVSPG
jgi:phosphoribosylglycinamide formyltransferase-1